MIPVADGVAALRPAVEGHPAAMMHLAKLLLRTGKADQAAALCSEALALAPGDAALAARGRALISYSVKIWLNEFLDLKKPNLAASTYSAYKWCYDSFIEFLGPRANAGIEHVEIPDIRAWRDAQKASGLSDKRVNNLLKYLSGPFTKAAKSGMIPINPVAATETLRVSDSVDRKPFSEEEVTKLLAHCPTDEWKLVLLLGVYCGMRLGDAANRLVDDFDLTNGTVAFIPEKKKRHQRAITLPLHASVRSAVAAAADSARKKEEKFLGAPENLVG